MLESLKIENFRCLSNFHVEKLGRVNLIVGKNNSGKSSLLEALRIYARKGNPALLREIAVSHDETYVTNNTNTSERASNEEQDTAFQAFFTGREFPTEDGKSIYIGDESGKSFVKIEHALYIDEFEEVKDIDGDIIRRRRRKQIEKNDLFPNDQPALQALLVTASETSGQGWIELNDSMYPRRANIFWERTSLELPLSYVPTQFLSLDYLAQLWDQIVFSPHEESVKSALRIIEQSVEEIAFVQAAPEDIRKVRRPERTAKVKLKGLKSGIPLNSMGDGMLRVLQLALTIFPAKGGLLLIDEFENGLHWTAQEKIWRLVFKLATELNIQVFATSHSNDALKGFAIAANAHPEVGTLIRLTRPELDSTSGEPSATVASFDEVSLLAATEAEIEIR
jgi:AAA15 family ATPase/GTPase